LLKSILAFAASADVPKIKIAGIAFRLNLFFRGAFLEILFFIE